MNNTTVSSIISSLLTGLENGVMALVMGVLAVFMPQLLELSAQDFATVAANFQKFLAAIEAGTPWGQALADMLTADWNAVEDSGKQAAIDFAEAVGTILEKAGLAKAS